MSLLEVNDLGFGYAGDSLFEAVHFRLNPGERAALVAPNGAGKSTLLRLIAGELSPDQGLVSVKRGAKVGYYRQSHEFARSGTIIEALLSGFQDIVELRAQLTEAQVQAATGQTEDLDRLAELTDRYQHTGADQLERRVEMIAAHLGFDSSQIERPLASLSGGEHGRLALGTVLATEPDLLLLDEPTNHLDLDTIRWLESYLLKWNGTVMIVSHDRAFLDAVCPITMELGRRSFRIYPLPYTQYYAERAIDLERERRLAEEQSSFIAKTEDFIRKNISGQKTKQAQSRRKMLEKLDRVDRPEDTWATAERVRFRFAEAPRSGDIVVDAQGLCAARGGRTLFENLDLLIRRGDRVGIVGPNGSGKTTLLKLLAGFGDNEDSGLIKRGTNLREGYFDQHLGSLDEQKSCIEEIRSIRGDLSQDATRQYLARFRFYGDDSFRSVKNLSGGERSRLALAKLLLEPKNLLFLDEPTNHLDIPAAEILEEALVGFPGTVVLVSHDRRFLERVTTRTINFDTKNLDIYDAGFLEYTQVKARQLELAQLESQELSASPPQGKGKSKGKSKSSSSGSKASASSSAARHEARRAASRERERRQKRVKTLERQIDESEQRLKALRAQLSEAPGEDWEKLSDLATEEQKLAHEVDKMMTEWSTLLEELGNE